MAACIGIGAVAACADDLTGVWRCNDGGSCYLRQLGDEVWWYGEASPDSPGWSNVANGRLHGNSLRLKWADVPKGGPWAAAHCISRFWKTEELLP
jgi:hypothetical protein